MSGNILDTGVATELTVPMTTTTHSNWIDTDPIGPEFCPRSNPAYAAFLADRHSRGIWGSVDDDIAAFKAAGRKGPDHSAGPVAVPHAVTVAASGPIVEAPAKRTFLQTLACGHVKPWTSVKAPSGSAICVECDGRPKVRILEVVAA